MIFHLSNVQAAIISAQVTTDAEVFSQPDYKSRVVEKLSSGSLVYLKNEKVVGLGGLGVFYKVKTLKGKIGFVVDADLAVNEDGSIKSVKAPPKIVAPPVQAAPRPPPPAEPSEPPPPSEPQQPAQARPRAAPVKPDSWGLTAGAANYTADFEGKNYSATQLFFGARWSGNWRGLAGFRPDAGALISPNAPKFLSAAGASGETKGFILLTDFSLLYPFVESDDFSLSAGGGPLVGYSSFSTKYNGQDKKSSVFKIGGVADVGAAINFDSGRVRLDVRYFLEKSGYLGGFLTVQLHL